ncbi:MAG: hypothetical protein ACI8PZ_003617 [Myxococcota bacterium]|jgi:hypothetical protein
MDDAWIVARFARTLWQSGVPTFDLTRPPVEAVSDPLWTALAVPLVAAGLDPVVPLRWLGGGCWLALVAGACRWAAVRSERPVAAAVVTGTALALSGGLAYHAVNGLETALWAGCVVAGAAWATGALPMAAGIAAVIGIAWGRPEAPWVLLGLAGLAWGRSRTPLVAGGVALGALVAARLAVYGAWLPNTAWAKPPDLSAGWLYLVDWLWWTGGLAPLVVLWRWPRLGLFIAWLALGVALSGGDWMPAHRRLMEASVLLAVGLGASGHLRIAWLAAGLWGVGSLTAAVRDDDGAAWYHDALAEVGERANEAGITRIAAFDVGRLGWVFTGSIHDLAGLTDARIGQSRGRHGQKPFDAAWFDAAAPEWAVLTTLNDPTEGPPELIRAEAAVWDHVADTWEVVWVERVGDPDHLIVLQRPGHPDL